MTAVTAKVVCSKPDAEHARSLSFSADYADGRNAEWADATPYINVSMGVNPDAAALFENGGHYTLTFTPSED